MSPDKTDYISNKQECQTRKDLKVHLEAHEEDAGEDEQNSEETSNYPKHSMQSTRALHVQRTDAITAKLSGKSDVFLCQVCGKVNHNETSV